jgi:hypothetical protein
VQHTPADGPEQPLPEEQAEADRQEKSGEEDRREGDAPEDRRPFGLSGDVPELGPGELDVCSQQTLRGIARRAQLLAQPRCARRSLRGIPRRVQL